MMKRCWLHVATGAGFLAVLLGVAAPVSAQSLGSAQSYAVLGGTTVTAAGTGSVINGDVGVSPGTSMTGFPAGATILPPFSTHANDGSAIAAQAATAALYTTLANTGGATAIGPELGGVVLTPGTYAFSTTANIASGTTLTLTGGGNYIFKVGSALTANVLSNVLLQNGATACNVFWQVTSAATLNGATFSGNVVAQAGVTLGVGASLSGRALTTAAGAVTMSGGNVVGGCSTAAVCPVITLSPPTLPNGTVGVLYPTQTITGSGGTAPYTFTVASGTLPAGLTLTSAGVLAGTPTTAGSSTFTVRGTDANGCFAEVTYTIVIAATCPVITLTPPTLPPGAVGVSYSQTITGSGGTAPYTFSVTSGTLPAGLTLTTAGVLAGTPTTAGSSTVTIRGTDANGCFASLVYTIVIAATPPVCPVITLSPPTLPPGAVGVSYSQAITGSGGTAPYTFGVTSGTLPAGLTLTAAGVLAGTPTTAGSSTVTIRGTDANGCFASLVYTIVIAVPPVCPVITIAPATLPNGTAGAAYSQTITGSGGTGPYTFSVTLGSLPAGLTLTAAGVLAGTPTTPGTTTFTVRGTDANGCFAERIYTLVVACPTITLAPPTLPSGTVGVAYNQTITASGGTGPYTFSVTSGALPAGLTLTPAGVVSGTPTTAGTTTVTIRGTDASGCFAELAYGIAIATAVPTLPQAFVLLLALGLVAAAYFRLRQRARAD